MWVFTVLYNMGVNDNQNFFAKHTHTRWILSTCHTDVSRLETWEVTPKRGNRPIEENSFTDSTDRCRSTSSVKDLDMEDYNEAFDADLFTYESLEPQEEHRRGRTARLERGRQVRQVRRHAMTGPKCEKVSWVGM